MIPKDSLSTFSGKIINLRLVEEADASFIISIRSSAAENGFLSTIDPSEDCQKNWIRTYKEREAAGLEYYYVITTKDQIPCGTARLYDIDNNTCNFGSFVLGQNKPHRAALDSIVAIFSFAFNVLKLKHCEIKVSRFNDHAFSFYKRFGMQETKREEGEIYLVYRKDTFIKNFNIYNQSIEARK